MLTLTSLYCPCHQHSTILTPTIMTLTKAIVSYLRVGGAIVVVVVVVDVDVVVVVVVLLLLLLLFFVCCLLFVVVIGCFVFRVRWLFIVISCVGCWCRRGCCCFCCSCCCCCCCCCLLFIVMSVFLLVAIGLSNCMLSACYSLFLW